MKKAALTEKFVVDSKGKKTAVILPVKRFQKLMEDMHDLAIVAERRNEKPISLDEIKKRLKKHGLV
ncbi:MAG: type II toxin-antitoxin system Phd/YefM family antitoxin [Acidobacteria bacterium]|nr:type II toxin-antitoxin system Phd/YefM family antitoxin [Acidobacteriota bacterium]